VSASANAMIERVRLLIQDRGYTYQQASEELGCPLRSVYRYAARAGLVPPNANTASAAAARRPKKKGKLVKTLEQVLMPSAVVATDEEEAAARTVAVAEELHDLVGEVVRSDLPADVAQAALLAAIDVLTDALDPETEPA